MASDHFDILIVGGGPAGAACAAFCARDGFKTLVIEKAVFPREKVCGDCLNPACWPVLERMGAADKVRALPHSKLAELEFISLRGRSVKFRLNASAHGEVAIRRSLFDHALLQHALECGAEVRQGQAVTKVVKGWDVHTTAGEVLRSRVLVAADGRNSFVARMLGFLPAAGRDRVALQTHIRRPRDFGERVVLRFLDDGYSGYGSVGEDLLALCLVGKPPHIPALKNWAQENFGVSADESWNTITPLSRAPLRTAAENLFFVGDTARVVEPFTGEGISYALASAELAAKHIREGLPARDYCRAHARLYKGRLWVNRIAKFAVLQPRLGSVALEVMQRHPRLLRYLAAKIVGAALLGG